MAGNLSVEIRVHRWFARCWRIWQRGEGPQHCYGCHTDLQKTMKTASHVHKPASENCVTCHSPHSSDYERELNGPITQTCLACHKDVGKEVAGATMKHAAMTSDHQCANCHTAHGSNHGSLLKQRMDKVCLQCHNKDAPLRTRLALVTSASFT